MHVTLGLLQVVGAGIAFIAFVIVAISVVSLILSAIKIVKEYEREGPLSVAAVAIRPYRTPSFKFDLDAGLDAKIAEILGYGFRMVSYDLLCF